MITGRRMIIKQLVLVTFCLLIVSCTEESIKSEDHILNITNEYSYIPNMLTWDTLQYRDLEIYDFFSLSGSQADTI
jgi:hypothetical protein